jgi:tetratricopeptide (TPR) repeat protein
MTQLRRWARTATVSCAVLGLLTCLPANIRHIELQTGLARGATPLSAADLVIAHPKPLQYFADCAGSAPAGLAVHAALSVHCGLPVEPQRGVEPLLAGLQVVQLQMHGKAAEADAVMQQRPALFSKALRQAGVALFEGERYDQSLSVLLAAERVDPTPAPEHALAYARLSELFEKHQDWSQDLFYAERYASVRPDDWHAHYRMAAAHNYLGQFSLAAQNMAAAERLGAAEDFPPFHAQYAATLERAGQLGAAQEYFEQAVRERPNDVEAAWLYGKFLVSQGQPEAADPFLKLVVREGTPARAKQASEWLRR